MNNLEYKTLDNLIENELKMQTQRFEQKQQEIINNKLEEKDKEIKRLKQEKDDLDDYNRHLYNENKKLNNIINNYENMKKELLDYIYHNEYCRFGHIDGGEADEMKEIISKTDKLKELKEGK